MLPEWVDSNDCRVKAETMWRIVRRWHPLGEDKVVDEAMAEIRRSLDELNDDLKNSEPEAYDMEEEV